MQLAARRIRWALLTRPFGALLVTGLAVATAVAHPGSGIVVDGQGQLFFVDTGHGVWKVDTQGRLQPHGGPGFHWMTRVV